VRDVSKLRQFIEHVDTPSEDNMIEDPVSNDDFELLKESPMLGDGKFKLEIGGSTGHLWSRQKLNTRCPLV
jgi:hypothetical protein